MPSRYGVKHVRQFSLALLMCSFTACSLIPKQPASDSPLPLQYQDSSHSGQALTDWQTFTNDKRLHALLQLALDNNQDYALSALLLARTKAQYRIHRANRLPSFSLAAREEHRGNSQQDDVSRQAQLGVELNLFELDLFGRVASLQEAARREYRASESEWHAARLSLSAAVCSHYLILLADEEARLLLLQTLTAYEHSQQLVSQKVENGMATLLELHHAESELQNAKAELAKLVRQQHKNRQAMWQLLGVKHWPEALLPDGLVLSKDGPDLPVTAAGLPSELLTRRPDIVAAEQRLQAANATIGAARAAFFPRITLTGNSGRISNNLSSLLDNATRSWSLVPQLDLPIFDAGTRQASLQLARTDYEIAALNYHKTLRQAFSEVADALTAEESWQQQLQAGQARLKAADATHSLAELRYQHGSISYLELLESRRTATRAKQLLLEDKLAAWHNRIMLFKALGGGWKTPDTISH